MGIGCETIAQNIVESNQIELIVSDLSNTLKSSKIRRRLIDASNLHSEIDRIDKSARLRAISQMEMPEVFPPALRAAVHSTNIFYT